MANVVEFILKLKDMMSGGYQRVAGTAQSTMRTAENATRRVAGAANQTSTAIAGTTRNVRGLRSEVSGLNATRATIRVDTSQVTSARREIGNLRNSASGKGGGGILGMLGSGARGLAAGLGLIGGVGALATGGAKAIGMGMDAGAQKVSFQTMAGDQAGGKLFTDVTKYAQESIFGNELYQNAQTMLAFGAAAKDVMPDIKMLGDISMGNKEKLQSLTLAFSQIRSTGRLTGQDLLQLVNAGFNPLQEISAKTGVGMAELKKRMENGAISFDLVKSAFESATGPGGRFFNMTQKIAETPFGKWEAFKGQIGGIVTQLGTALLPVVSKVVDFLSMAAGYLPPIIGSLSGILSPMAEINVSTASWSGYLDNVKSLAFTVWDYNKKVLGTIWNVIKGVIEWGSRSEIIKDVFSGIIGFAQGIYKVMTWIVDKLSWLFDNVVKPILNAIDNAYRFIKGTETIQAQTQREEQNRLRKNAADVYQQIETQRLRGIANEVYAGIDAQLAKKTGGSGIQQMLTSGGGKGEGKISSPGVTHNGPKTLSVNFNKEFIGQLSIISQNIKEGVGDMERMIEEAVIRVFYSLESAQ